MRNRQLNASGVGFARRQARRNAKTGWVCANALQTGGAAPSVLPGSSRSLPDRRAIMLPHCPILQRVAR
jgi:hypothetical protein